LLFKILQLELPDDIHEINFQFNKIQTWIGILSALKHNQVCVR